MLHLGWRAVKHGRGILSADGTYNSGVNFFTPLKPNIPDGTNYLNNEKCIIYKRNNTKVEIAHPCPEAYSICQKPLGKVLI